MPYIGKKGKRYYLMNNEFKIYVKLKMIAHHYQHPIMLFISFLLPFLIMGFSFFQHGVYPFGDRRILVIDFSNSYFPFINEYYARIRSFNFSSFSFAAGIGMDYVLHWAAYLSSPFVFLGALVPHQHLIEYITLTVLIRLGLAGLLMAMYLKYIGKGSDIMLPAFSALYALCGFILINYINIHWLDGFALVPLCLLGLAKLVDTGDYKLYIVSLTCAIIFSFYIAIYICLLIFFMFFLKMAIRENPLHLHKKEIFLNRLKIISLATLATFGLSAFMLLPMYAGSQLVNRAGQDIVFPDLFYARWRVVDILGSFIPFSINPNFTIAGFMEGMPHIYTGMISLMLLPVFIMRKEIKFVEKLFYLTLFIFLLIATNFDFWQFVMHLLTYTRAFPSRFSFLISFFLLIMAYRAYGVIKDQVTGADIRHMFYGAAIFLLAARSGVQDNLYVLWSTLAALGYFILFGVLATLKVGEAGSTKNVIKLGLSVLIVIELAFTSYMGMSAVGVLSRHNYPRHFDLAQEALAHRQRMPTDFFRTDFARQGTSNDAALYTTSQHPMYGITSFSSFNNQALREFAMALGLQVVVVGDTYRYLETSPLTNAFFALRYVIDLDGTPAGVGHFFDRVDTPTAEPVALIRNNYHLPLGFMVHSDLATHTWVPNSNTQFQAQNAFFTAASGIEQELFTFYRVSAGTEWEGNAFRYELVVEAPMGIDLYIRASAGQLRIYRNGVFERTTINVATPISAVGNFAYGDVVGITTTTANHHIDIGIIDRELFAQAHAAWASSPLMITSFSETRITGYVNVQETGLLYTSIPNLGNWRVDVNGERQEPVLIMGIMTGVMLEPGYHQIQLRYVNPSFVIGMGISGVSLAGVIILPYVMKNGQKRSLKDE